MSEETAPRQPGREPRRPGGPGRSLDHGLPVVLGPGAGEGDRHPGGPTLPQRAQALGAAHHKTLDEFDFAFQPELDARKVKDLATLGFVEAKGNVAVLGPPGGGKTMLAVGLAIVACQAGFSIYFTTLDDMVRQLRRRRSRGGRRL